MSDTDPRSQSSHDRRAFFRRGLSELMRPASKFIAARLPGIMPSGTKPLRPPGALPEPDFLDTCYRCGSCADHCPADAITLVKSDERKLHGTPTIEPARRACVICDELSCMKVCPSGALKLVGRGEIRVGLAVWDAAECLRKPMGSPSDGNVTAPAGNAGDPPAAPESDDCMICVNACPIGDTAIRIENGDVRVIDPRPTGAGCTGCGVCEEQCPTRPQRAIRILPYALHAK